MINYNYIKIKGNVVRVEVKLEGKKVGEIRSVGDQGWAYYPISAGSLSISPAKGKTYPTIEAVKTSLVTDEEEDQTPPKPDFSNMSFDEKVRADYFKNPLPYGPGTAEKEAYRQKEQQLREEFNEGMTAWLAAQGVPAQYISKVSYAAYEDGHSGGYSEVVNCAYKFIEIFK